MIYIGNNKIGSVAIGDTPIAKIYKGSELVFEKQSQGFTILSSGDSISYTLDSSYYTTKIVPNTPTFVKIKYLDAKVLRFKDTYKKVESVDLSSLDFSNYNSFESTFYRMENLTTINLGNLSKCHPTDVYCMFYQCLALTNINGLGTLNCDASIRADEMFAYLYEIEYLDLSSFNFSSTDNADNQFYMFKSCIALKKIRCKQGFKDWCIANQETIALPSAMKEGGKGVWEIVD